MTSSAVLIQPVELRACAASPVLLDVRWALGDPHGHQQYLDGHLPGAVFVDMETELAAPPSAALGRHPLPSVADVQAAARRWGITDLDTAVVAYDASGGMAAARAWWLLRWAGLTDVRILDGGVSSWTESGGALSTEVPSPAPGGVTLTPGALPTIEADDAAQWPARGVLLDARAAGRYRGEAEPVDPRAGHIPGALSAPTAGNLGPDGRFLPADALRARYAAYGPGEVAVYCGSGVTAAHQIAALAIAGIPATLYPGSWSQWSADPSRPVALG